MNQKFLFSFTVFIFSSLLVQCTQTEKTIPGNQCKIQDLPLIRKNGLYLIELELAIPECNIPKAKYKLVYDTGSNYTYLRSKFCHSGQLPHENLQIQTVSGKYNYQIQYANVHSPDLLPSLINGKIYFFDFAELIPADGILGNNLLQKSVTLTSLPEKIRFVDHSACLNISFSPYRFVDGQIEVEMTLEKGLKEKAILDSGSPISYLHGHSAQECLQTKAVEYTDITDKKFKGIRCTLRDVCVSGFCVDTLDFILPLEQKNKTNPKNILGNNFLEKFILVNDYRKQQMAILPMNKP